jgi:hypothetical protein
LNAPAHSASPGLIASDRKVSKGSIVVLALSVLTAFGLLLYMVRLFSSFGLGEDWFQYNQTGWRLLQGLPIYGTPIAEILYLYNPPWMILLLLPLEVLPFQIGYALLLLISLGLVVVVAQRYKLGLVAVLLIIASPPVIYTLSHGQVDILVVAGCLLVPAYLIPLVAMMKPQDAVLSVLSIPKSRWKATLLVTVAVVGLSFVCFGWWPMVVAREPGPVLDLPGLMRGTWPYKLGLGAVMLAIALYKKDNLLLLAASPLFSPYAHTYSFIGLSLCVARLKPLPAFLLVAAWWAACLYTPWFW